MSREQTSTRRSSSFRLMRRRNAPPGRPSPELKIIARGLRHPGPVHMLRTHLLLAGSAALVVRVIVDSAEAADGLARYCVNRQVAAEIDLVGDEFHVLIRAGSATDRILAGTTEEN